ncbi:MAG: response regulator [Nitrososphaera sp.]
MISKTDKKDKALDRLLVVDDDPDNAYVFKHSLLRYGFLVDAFTNPEDALQSFKSSPNRYSLVLSDGGMPSVSGNQLSKKVKEINPNVKVLLLTGFEIRGIKHSKSSSSNSVDGFAQKPIGIRELTDKILSLIGETKGRSSFEG